MIALYIYLIGCPLSYLYLRYGIRKTFGEWTLGDRYFGILAFLFSWVGIIATYFTYIVDGNAKYNKKVKW